KIERWLARSPVQHKALRAARGRLPIVDLPPRRSRIGGLGIIVFVEVDRLAPSPTLAGKSAHRGEIGGKIDPAAEEAPGKVAYRRQEQQNADNVADKTGDEQQKSRQQDHDAMGEI